MRYNELRRMLCRTVVAGYHLALLSRLTQGSSRLLHSHASTLRLAYRTIASQATQTNARRTRRNNSNTASPTPIVAATETQSVVTSSGVGTQSSDGSHTDAVVAEPRRRRKPRRKATTTTTEGSHSEHAATCEMELTAFLQEWSLLCQAQNTSSSANDKQSEENDEGCVALSEMALFAGQGVTGGTTATSSTTHYNVTHSNDISYDRGRLLTAIEDILQQQPSASATPYPLLYTFFHTTQHANASQQQHQTHITQTKDTKAAQSLKASQGTSETAIQFVCSEGIRAWLASDRAVSVILTLLHFLSDSTTAVSSSEAMRERRERLVSSICTALATVCRTPQNTIFAEDAQRVTRVTLYLLWYGCRRVASRHHIVSNNNNDIGSSNETDTLSSQRSRRHRSRRAAEQSRLEMSWLRRVLLCLLQGVVMPLLNTTQSVSSNSHNNMTGQYECKGTAVERVMQLAVLSLAVEAAQLVETLNTENKEVSSTQRKDNTTHAEETESNEETPDIQQTLATLRTAVDEKYTTLLDWLDGCVSGITERLSHTPPTPKHKNIPDNFNNEAINEIGRQLCDVLDAVQLSRSLATALPFHCPTQLERRAERMLRNVCSAVAKQPRVFTELLCQPSLARRLAALQQQAQTQQHVNDGSGGNNNNSAQYSNGSGGVLYEQACTDICAAVVTWLQHCSNNTTKEDKDMREGCPAVMQLMERCEAMRYAMLNSATSPGTQHSSTVKKHTRPALCAPSAQLCYAMLCVGYDPTALLQSELCSLEGSAGDMVALLQVLAAAAQLTPRFATSSAALPLYVRQAWVEEVKKEAARCVRVLRAGSVLTIEDQSATLNVWLTRGAHVTSTLRRRLRGPERNDLVQPDLLRSRIAYALYIALHGIVEAILREVNDMLTPLMLALCALVEQLGLVRSGPCGVCACYAELAHVIRSTVSERLDSLGVLDLSQSSPLLHTRNTAEGKSENTASTKDAKTVGQDKHGKPEVPLLSTCTTTTTTAGMETCLTECTALLVPRLAEAVTVALASSNNTLNSSSSGSRRHATATVEDNTPSLYTQEELQQLLLQRVLTCSADLVVCGMRRSTVSQLLSIHGALLKAYTSSMEAKRDAATLVERLNEWLDLVESSRFHVRRAAQSLAVRDMGIVLNDIIALHLTTTNITVRDEDVLLQGSMERSNTVLPVLHLLYRLRTSYPIQAEPVALRNFRTEQLDPALTRVLEAHLTNKSNSIQLGLNTLAEMATIMAVRRTVHYVSLGFFASLTEAVEHCVVALESFSSKDKAHRVPSLYTTSVPIQQSSSEAAHATRLLCASAVLCLRHDARFTQLYLRQLSALEPCLSQQGCITVMQAMLDLQLPMSPLPVRRMVDRLVQPLQHYLHEQSNNNKKSTQGGNDDVVTVSETITILQTLALYDEAVQQQQHAQPSHTTTNNSDNDSGLVVPYAAVLRRLMQERDGRNALPFDAGQCGILVRVVAHLHTRSHNVNHSPLLSVEVQCVHELPRTLAMHVMAQGLTSIAPAQLPLLLKGYASLQGDYVTLRTAVLRSLIARTIHLCPQLSAEQLVHCVEAYAMSGIDHPHLFGLLLARVTDLRQGFSLELALRLLRAGSQAGCGPTVRTTCLTAAQPIFASLVRHVLQSDPDLLASVASISVTILHGLRDCFPQDPISAAVLENLTHYHHAANGAVTCAALELIEARGAMDYTALRVLSEHSIAHLMPQCTGEEIVRLVQLLVQCGVRSAALLEGLRKQFALVGPTMRWEPLVQLAGAVLRACVEVDAETARLYMSRVRQLVTYESSNTDSVSQSKVVQESSKQGKGKRKSKAAARKVTTQSDKEAKSNDTPISRIEGQVTCVTAAQVATVLQMLHTTHLPQLSVERTATIDALLAALQRTYCTSSTTQTSTIGWSAADMSAILRACMQDSTSPRPYTALINLCADELHRQLSTHQQQEDKDVKECKAETTSGTTNVIPAASSSLARADLVVLVQLIDYLVQLNMASHAAIPLLLALLYERRSVLLQRHMLLETTRLALQRTGKAAHPALYALVVEKALL